MPDSSEVTDAELTFLKELVRLEVRFMIVGMSAAVIQGADVATEDVDLWFPSLTDPNIDAAARKAGGVLARRAKPPMISGPDLAHIDIVTRCDGLRSFDTEYAKAKKAELFGVSVKILPIERVLASKMAANRAKDKATIPALQAAIAGGKYRGKR